MSDIEKEKTIELNSWVRLKINNDVVIDENKIINQNNFDQNNSMKVSHGKKQHVIVKII